MKRGSPVRIGGVLLVVRGLLAEVCDLLLDVVAVVADGLLEVADLDGEGLLGGGDFELATLSGGDVVVQGLEGGTGGAFFALEELGVGFLDLADAELAGGAEDLNLFLGEGLALLEKVAVELATELSDLFFEVDAVLRLELDVLAGLLAVAGGVDFC